MDKEFPYWNLEQKIIFPLLAQKLSITIQIDQGRKTGREYYSHTYFKIHIIDNEGVEYGLGGGGFTDWTAKYLGSRKERLFISSLESSRMICLKQ